MVCIGFTLRIAFIHSDYYENGISKWADAKLYWDTGQQFASGNWFPDVYGGNSNEGYMIVGPFLPLLIGIMILLFGNNPVPMLIVNAICSTLLIPVLFFLGKKIVNKYAGWCMAMWATLNLSLIRLNSQTRKEPLLVFFMALMILLIVRYYFNRKAVGSLIWSSVVFSLLIHTDERYIVYAPILVMLILAGSFQTRKALIHASLFILFVLASMIPWTVRNYYQFHELVILTPRTSAITSKVWGTNLSYLQFNNKEKRDELNRKRLAMLSDSEIAQKYPPREYGRFEKYYLAFYHYWKPTYFRPTYIQYGFRMVQWSFSHNLSGLVFYGFFLPFYFMGTTLALIKRNHIIAFLAIIPLVHGLLHTLMIWPLERYRIPTNSLIVLVAVWMMHRLYCRYRMYTNAPLSSDDKQRINNNVES
jgi:4-amino-4-deoxy-L-arabinose transferase-like glycosyltransferase